MKVSFTKHFGLFGLLTLLLLLLIQPVAAQVVPSMNLYINWTPDEQLTSFDEDGSLVIEADEERFASAQIFINGNVQFWAVDISCRIGTGAELNLEDITFPEGTWGVAGTDYFVTPTGGGVGGIATRYNQPVGGGTLAFTLTRIGNTTTPVGTNGVNYTLPIANVRFQVENRTADALVATTCTVIRFLDRNGRQTMIGRQATFTNLYVRIGYTLKGMAVRQGATNHLNIRVTCTHVASGTPRVAYTLATGNFTFGGATLTSQTANHLRDFGLYRCVYRSDLNQNNTVDGSDDQFLETVSYINLTTPKYQLMPLTVRSGDFDASNTIALADFNAITGAFGQLATLAFDDGDANGDRYINQNDLALVAGNVDLSDAVDPLSAEHALYSLGTDYNTTRPFPNSRVQMGTPDSGAIARRFAASMTRDFWATLAPDGSEYAYVSQNTVTRVHSLNIGNMTTGAGVPFRLPVGFQYPESFAPSWSPDGGMLAWICTYNQVGAAGEPLGGYQLNEGALCYANRGDLRANTVTIVDNSIDSIFPPAWLSYPYQDGVGFAIIYSDGGQLRYYDLTSNTSGLVNDLPAGSDMPVVINHWTGDSYLFYRFDTGSSYELRVAKLELANTYSVDTVGLTFGPTPFGAAGNSGGPTDALHMIVDDTADVDYYDVSQFLDIMLYDDLAGFNTTNIYFAAAPTDATPDLSTDFWTAAAEPHFVDGNVGNPTQDSLGFGEWDYVMTNPTFLHAHRVTFDWLP
jgi:hypothetical protein